MLEKNKEENLEKIRHSISHLMSMAIMEIYPKAGLGVGPSIDDGFYQDYDLGDAKISDDIFPRLEKRIKELIQENIEFIQNDSNFEDAFKFYKDDPYKTEMARELQKEGKKNLSFYDSGNFHNLCSGPHIKNSSEINPEAFKLTKIAGAYWRGDENNKMLTRIYGAAFETKKELDTYLERLEEAKKRDHKKLGKELDLFTFSPLVGAGLPLWTPKGTLIRHLLDNFVWELRSKYGYQKVEIPHITKKELYETSGHWDKFKDELFKITTREGHEFAMKPMNCPHHTQIYARRPWSYKDLPVRYANTTTCYRDEQTGELAGLTRVRAFAQDDAHVFCRVDQTKDEFLKIWDIVNDFYLAFGFELEVRLSLHDPEESKKYLGDKKIWEKAEKMLQRIVKGKKIKSYEAIGEAAFYGPKLDFIAKDAIGREWQVATIQLDMVMPERFDLTCVNEKGDKERIVMIHAAIMGSLERFMSILIEHTAGKFPLWLSPVQARIIAVSDKFQDYGEKVLAELEEAGIRTEIAPADETLGKRIRKAKEDRIPYILVVGEKEKKNQSVNVEHHKEGKLDEMKTAKLIARLESEILKKKL